MSVIVPVYNVAKYLVECIESLIGQTYSNVEIILVDDGSTDKSGWTCDRYAVDYAEIVSFHKANGGLSDARNFGVERCHGDYVVFVDSDDLVSPIFVEALVKAMEQSECGMAAFAFSTSFRDGDAPRLCRSMLEVEELAIVEHLSAKDYIDRLLRHMCDTGAPFRIYTRAAVLSHPFPVGMTFEDAATVYRIVHDIDVVAVISCAELYAYRQRDGSIIHSGADGRMVESAINIGRQVERDMREWYPDNWVSACSCGFSINRMALMRTSSSQSEYRNQLWNEMSHYRSGLLNDSAAKPIKRVAAALSYLGIAPFLTLSKAFDAVKKVDA